MVANFRIETSGPIHCEGRNDGIDAAAVGKTGVDHWLGFVYPAPDR